MNDKTQSTSTTTNQEPINTPFYANHLAANAKLVAYADHYLPIQYPSGALSEHKAAREEAALFDVSHMGQISIKGETWQQLAACLQQIVPANIEGLAAGKMRYTQLMNDEGGIVDDCIVTHNQVEHGAELGIVVNGSRRAVDLKLLQSIFSDGINTEFTKGLLALQGPKARLVLKELGFHGELAFMTAQQTELQGIPIKISCCGYTGEDGFELSALKENCASLWDMLINNTHVKPAGLAARDTLRLEAGLPLYGQDLSEEISPLQAGLKWSFGKDRLQNLNCLGGKHLSNELTNGIERHIIGLTLEGKLPARSGAEICLAENAPAIGVVTSGAPSPTLGYPIAMGIINNATKPKENDVVFVKVRQHIIKAKVTKMPFVQHRYFRK